MVSDQLGSPDLLKVWKQSFCSLVKLDRLLSLKIYIDTSRVFCNFFLSSLLLSSQNKYLKFLGKNNINQYQLFFFFFFFYWWLCCLPFFLLYKVILEKLISFLSFFCFICLDQYFSTGISWNPRVLQEIKIKL